MLEKKKKSRYWLAKKIGMSDRNLRQFSKGKTTRIEFETLEKICKELDCQPGDLLLYRDDK